MCFFFVGRKRWTVHEESDATNSSGIKSAGDSQMIKHTKKKRADLYFWHWGHFLIDPCFLAVTLSHCLSTGFQYWARKRWSYVLGPTVAGTYHDTLHLSTLSHNYIRNTHIHTNTYTQTHGRALYIRRLWYEGGSTKNPKIGATYWTPWSSLLTNQ